MITTAFFNDKSAYEHYGFFVKSYQIGEARARTSVVEVPAMNGYLDYTEAFSEVAFDNRDIKINLKHVGEKEKSQEFYSRLCNDINGRFITVTFGDELNHYWEGRASVGNLSYNSLSATCTVTLDAYPFRHEQSDTVISLPLTDNYAKINLRNGRETLLPTIRTDIAAKIKIGVNEYDISQSTTYLTALVLKEGDNFIEVKSSTPGADGRITFTYRKGEL